jgi:hypothetical protein
MVDPSSLSCIDVPLLSGREEPSQRAEKGLEIPVSTRKDWDDTLSKIVKPPVRLPIQKMMRQARART